MIKRILKTMFPLLLLRNIALRLNVLKIKYYYPLIFSDYLTSKKDFILYKEVNPFLQMNLLLGHLSSEVRKSFFLWEDENWMQEEYIATPSVQLFIEPSVGWGITSSRQLYKPSLGFSSAPYVKRPSLNGFLNRHNKETSFERAISFRDTGEENYFHFFNDVLAKFFFLKNNELLTKELPLIISEKLFNKSYFQFFYTKTYLKEYYWYVQKSDEYICIDQAVFCKPLTHSKYIFDEIKELLPWQESSSQETKRVFLTRNKGSLRYLENQDELTDLLKKYSFLTIDASTLSFEQQVKLFSQTEHLIAVHGAGLSNMMFRKPGEMKVLEIFSPYAPLSPFHYVMLAHMYEHPYNAIIGDTGKERLTGGFRLECGVFEKYLKLNVY